MNGTALGIEAERERQLVAFLARHYETTTAARALWRWTGAPEDELAAAGAEEDPLARWGALWRQAAEPTGRANPLSLLREALFDRPSDPLLLDVLYEAAEARFPAAAAVVDLVLIALERLRPFDFPPAPTRATLQAFPSVSWADAFCALAPALDERLGPEARELLLGRVEVLARLSPLVTRLRDLREELREAEESADPDGAEVMSDAMAALRGLREDVAAWPQDDPLVRELRRGIERLERRLGFRKAPEPRAAVAGLTSLLIGIDANVEDPFAELSAAAEGLAAAVRATRPDLAPDPFAPPAPEDAAVRYDGVPVGDAPRPGAPIDAGTTGLGEIEQVEGE